MEDVRRRSPLPVDALVPEVLLSLDRNPNLVIEAEPGAGKTTRIPAALLTAVHGDVLVLEPRRIAARLAARRVAWELDEEVGQTVGYQVRFEKVAGPATRLHFLTEGVLTRRLFSDPNLNGVDAVVLDEFHERHLESDLALALLKRLQRTTRPELRIVVMSATLETAPVAQFLGNCPVLRSQGRVFDLSIEHLPYSPEPLHEQVKGAVEVLLREGQDGGILVFLPGAAEIRRALRACELLARRANRLVLPLYGDLSPAEQDRVVAPASQAKLILATNVAESSVTIDGTTAVIDSGLARRAAYSPWTGLPTLSIGRVSKASARQRASGGGARGDPPPAACCASTRRWTSSSARTTRRRRFFAPIWPSFAWRCAPWASPSRASWSGLTRRRPQPSNLPRACSTVWELRMTRRGSSCVFRCTRAWRA
jgi:ATP-dependent helicase HrpB